MTSAQIATGIGLRTPHLREFLALRPPVPFVEVHTENHLCRGVMREALHDVRKSHDISFHCVGMSIGSAQGIDRAHLLAIRELVDEIDPMLVSDHLSMSTLDGTFTNDLLPLPYTEEALDHVAAQVDAVQTLLKRQILIENPSRYFSYRHSTLDEGSFMTELTRRTSCGLLLDVNNVFVTASNTGEDPVKLLRQYPLDAVGEMHLAGHDTVGSAGKALRIDTHDRPVCDDVWQLFAAAAAHTRAPALIEWDNELPTLDVLLSEASKANRIATKPRSAHHAVAC
ncbi:MAG: DUF692 family protein [Alphaproteobacteria bacterium]|nr:DUF692 family protein [Alphaproteobacteria bacterium]